jgi:regulator of RNase E activity RraA
VEDAAVVGGVRLAVIARHGFAGLVTTARMRDFDEARAYSVPCWCRGETPLAGSAQAMPVATNVPLALGRATVLPGDLIHASDAGAIIIPAKDIERVLELAEEIERADAQRVAKATSERPLR